MSEGFKPPAPELEFFVDLERSVWQALVDGDPEADRQCLSDDFLGVYPSGFSQRQDHAAQLVDGPTVSSYELDECHLQTISDTAALLSYRADFERPDSPATITWFISSLWCLREGRWVNTFSQDTPADN